MPIMITLRTSVYQQNGNFMFLRLRLDVYMLINAYIVRFVISSNIIKISGLLNAEAS